MATLTFRIEFTVVCSMAVLVKSLLFNKVGVSPAANRESDPLIIVDGGVIFTSEVDLQWAHNSCTVHSNSRCTSTADVYQDVI